MLGRQDSFRDGSSRRGGHHSFYHLYGTFNHLYLGESNAANQYSNDQSPSEPKDPENGMGRLAHLLVFRSGVGPALARSFEALTANPSKMPGIL